MKLSNIVAQLELETVHAADMNREVLGAYTGDLLSWVMTRLDRDCGWITIMNNINVIAVASLADASCVIFTEDADIPNEVVEKAKSQGINLFRTKKTSFEISYLIGKILYAQ